MCVCVCVLATEEVTSGYLGHPWEIICDAMYRGGMLGPPGSTQVTRGAGSGSRALLPGKAAFQNSERKGRGAPVQESPREGSVNSQSAQSAPPREGLLVFILPKLIS